MEITQFKEQREKEEWRKNEQSLRKMWETNSLDIYVKEN